jgi:hypothetical protein
MADFATADPIAEVSSDAETANVDLDDSFYCPITADLMVRPSIRYQRLLSNSGSLYGVEIHLIKTLKVHISH